MEMQAYGHSGSYQAGLEARMPSALWAGTGIWQLRTQQHLEATTGGGWRMLFWENCFQAELCRMTLILSRTACITWDLKGWREDLNGTLGMLVRACFKQRR